MKKKARGLHGKMTFKRDATMADAVDYAERKLGCRVISTERDGRKITARVFIPMKRLNVFAMSHADRQFAFEQGDWA